jgi:dTDP-4-amino-4,6-dideoxygalactose transaminase
MWPRKQLDISWHDIAYGIGCVLWPGSGPTDGEVVADNWIPPGEALVSLSVRSAWDLLLSALQLPPESEILMSAVTVPDMARIVRHHGLVPVPVDVSAGTLAPALVDLEQAITPRTRAILIAHLFGTRVEMGPIVEFAAKHNLLVIEDCAQAYVGPEYAGHPGSDVALFSFGPIKTATALGGAISRVRDSSLRAEMSRRQAEYPVQSRRSYLSRLVKFVGIKLFTTRPVYSATIAYWRKRGVDYDRKIAGLARSFAPDRLFELIRRRPSVPLARMLYWRVETFEGSTATRLRRRIERSGRVAKQLAPGQVIGGENATHTYWVFPVRTGNRQVIDSLQAAGFDATRLSSLVIVPFAEERGRHDSQQRQLATWLDETVFLPNCDSMPEAEFDRMAAILSTVIGEPVPPLHAKREPADRSRVIVAP